jgi:hypothetical protein
MKPWEMCRIRIDPRPFSLAKTVAVLFQTHFLYHECPALGLPMQQATSRSHLPSVAKLSKEKVKPGLLSLV